MLNEDSRKKRDDGLPDAREEGRDPQGAARRRMARALAALSEQGEKIAGGAGVPGTEEPAPQDWPEVWGRRIGRGLGYLFALYLLWHLLTTYVLP